LTDDLEHLTEDQRKQVLEIFPNEIKDIEKPEAEPALEGEPEKGLEKKSEEQKEDWKKGYLDYEVKTKDSDRVVFEENEIEITEEDLE